MGYDANLLRHRMDPPDERRCIAKTQRGKGPRCKNWTMDPRIRVCRNHGAKAFDRFVGKWKGGAGGLVTGRYSRAVANIPEMEDLYQRTLEEADLMETKEEIALARAYISRLLEKGTHATISGEMMPALMGALDTIDKMVDRRHKRLHGANLTITVRDWETLLTRVFDLTHEFFGEQENYADFVRAIAHMNQPKNQLIEGKAEEVKTP